jgi:lycopene beta-cyclase
MVKGLDFYNQVFDLLSTQNITFIQKVLEIEESETIILVQTESESFRVLNYSTAFTTNKAKTRLNILFYNSIL